MRLRKSRSKVDASSGRTRGTNCRDGMRFQVRWCPNVDLIAHSEAAYVADLYIGRPGARICREIRVDGLRANMRHGNGLNPMADAVDI